ncbi:MAG TPA: UDP-N-acetylmuramate--L-alanine ligase [Longimicrobiales bacterium]|nr:UDP-N-acetylmuramate--L-alanine ligase [Longimicrobiales bacterium]
MIARDVNLRALASTGPVHFMGVGGAGMCALAELLLRAGGRVSGCDRKTSVAVEDLRGLGVEVQVGHDPSHLDDASAVVVTSAVPPDHPELLRAHERGLPVLKRAQALGAWVNEGRVLALAGTHGKTTTTAMATEMLVAAGMDPTGLVGGRVASWGGNLRYGASDLYVVEADEYDRSFHTLSPDVAVVTNLEADHLDIYGDLEGVRTGFRTFLRGVRAGGCVVACADDRGAASLLAGLDVPVVTYGLSPGTQVRAVDVDVGPASTTCRIMEDGRDAGTLALAIGGIHNLRNALGAAAAARRLGATWDAIRSAMEAFRGVGRRFERLGEARGVRVVDDYAHHPTEIRATLEAARATFPGARIVAAFQPHLYSRTRDFHAEFGQAMAAADVVWVTDVFPAREIPIPGVSGALVARAAEAAGAREVHYLERIEELAPALARELRDGDVLLTLGAGSVERLGGDVLQRLGEAVHA